MAILKDRMNYKSITDLQKVDFSTTSDAAAAEEKALSFTKKTETKTPAGTKVTPEVLNKLKTSPVTKSPAPSIQTAKQKALGIFKDIMCSDLMPIDMKKIDHALNLLRDIDLTFDLWPECDTHATFMDKLFGRTPFKLSDTEYGKLLGKIDTLKSIIDEKVRKFLGSLAGGGHYGFEACYRAEIDALLAKYNKASSGFSIKNKLGLDKLINPINFCSSNKKAQSTYSSQTGNSTILDTIILSGVINTLSKNNPALAVAYVQDLINTGLLSTDQILTAIAYSLLNDSGKNIEEKLLLANSFMGTITDPNKKQTSSIFTKGTLLPIIDSINSSTYRSNSPVSDYYNIINGLFGIDNKWNIDGDNELNYSLLTGNKRLADLAHNMAVNSFNEAYIKVFSAEGSEIGELSLKLEKIDGILSGATFRFNGVDYIILTVDEHSKLVNLNKELTSQLAKATELLIRNPIDISGEVKRDGLKDYLTIEVLNASKRNLENNNVTTSGPVATSAQTSLNPLLGRLMTSTSDTNNNTLTLGINSINNSNIIQEDTLLSDTDYNKLLGMSSSVTNGKFVSGERSRIDQIFRRACELNSLTA